MSIWGEHQVEARIVEVLSDVPTGVPHHFGRPFITSYQLAIELERRYPQVREALGYELGGAGTGVHYSFAQYLGKQLSDHIRDDLTFPVEGAFISDQDIVAMTYRKPDGDLMPSSVAGSGYDLALFRLPQTES